MKNRMKKHIKRPLTKRNVEEVEGTYAANSIRRHLHIAQVTNFNEADVEDLLTELWLEIHSEEAILEVLERSGLQRTPENIEKAHLLLSEELRDSKTLSLRARRVAERWKEERQRRKETSLETPVHTSATGDELLLKEALKQPEEDLRAYIPSEVSQKFEAEQVLTTEELKELSDYDAAKQPRGKRGAKRSKEPHANKARQRAKYLKAKAKRKLSKILR